MKQSFSVLGELNTPNYLLFNTCTFGIVGLFSLYFFRGLYLYYQDEMPWSLYYSYMLAGISWILTGIFPVSFDITWLYNVHLAAAFFSYIFACLALALSIKFFDTIEGYEFFALATGWSLFVVWGAIMTSFTTLTPELGQLISIFMYFIWQAAYSLKFYHEVT